MDIKPGWVWVERKGGYRPFVEFRQITKGANRGKVEVTLPAVNARKVIVEAKSIRRYPITATFKEENREDIPSS